MSGIRDVVLRRCDGSEETAAALGNNAAWNCSCGRAAPLLGSLMIRSGEVACPDCDARYVVVADGTRASAVREIPRRAR